MADQKVSQLAELAAGNLDPAVDWLLVSDMSALASKKMKASEMIRASLPYLSTFWDFMTGSLLPTVSFSRASTGWRFNSSGVLVPETTNAPRFQYDPATLTPRGLLVEGAATNNFLRSDALDNAAWTKSNVSVTADAGVAPDGTATMDKVVEDAANNSHYFRQSAPFVSGQTYAVEFFAKADGRSYAYCFLPSAAFTSPLTSYFDVATGVVVSTAAGCTTFVQPVGGGIYRCVILAVATATVSSNVQFGLSANGTSGTYLGDGASGVFFWGLSIKEIDCVTSNIPTTTAAVTRAADVALITNPQALADQCWIVRGRTPRKISGGAVNTVLHIDNGSNDNRRFLYYDTDGTMRASARVGGVSQCDLNLGVVATDTNFAVAVRWAENNFAASLNGGAIVTDLSGSNPLGLTTARVGRSINGSYWNSTIRTIETRRTASDAELPLLAA